MNTIKKNYLYNLAYQILAIIIPVITTPYVSRVLGATAIGDYGYTSGLVSYFGIIAATGTQAFAQREIAANRVSTYNRSVIFWNTLLFRVFCTACVSIVYFFFINHYLLEYRLLFKIQIISILSWITDISWYFQGIENFRIIVIRNTFVKLVATVSIFLFVKKKEDLWIYTVILSLSILLGNLTLWPHIIREVVIIKGKDIQIFLRSRDIFALFTPVIAIQVYTILDQTMLGAIANTTQVGYYSQAQKIIKIALTTLSSLMTVLLPRISALYVAGNKQKIDNYFQKTVSFVYMLAMPMMFGCIAISDRFVPFFFGKGYQPVSGLMQILSLLFIVLSIGQLYGSFLVAMKKHGVYTKAVVTAAFVNFILNYVLIAVCKLGALGAAWGTIAAEATSTVIQVYGARSCLNYRVLFNRLNSYLFPSAIMFIIVLLIKNVIDSNMLCVFISFICGVFVYFGILVCMHDSIAVLFLEKTKALLRRRKHY